MEEGVHGMMTPVCTVFPLGASIGSTWNPDLVSKVYEAVAREVRDSSSANILLKGTFTVKN